MKNHILAVVALSLIVVSCEQEDKQAAALLSTESTESAPSTGTPVQHQSALEVDSSRLVTGQRIFTPAYSGIAVTEDHVDLSATHLSIRNTSSQHPIHVSYVDYYGDDGTLLKNFIAEEIVIGPLGSKLYTINQNERLGGAGANFVIEWVSETAVTPALIESVTYRYSGTKALAFTSTNVVLAERQ